MVNFRRLRPKRRIHIGLYLLLLVLALVAGGLLRDFLPGIPASDSHKGFSKGDTLDVAVVYGPGSYEMSGDTLTGENYRLLALLRDSLGWSLRLWPVVSGAATLTSLSEGRYDVVASMTADNELRTKYLTTREVWLDQLVLVQRPAHGAERPITSALELAGDTVHVEAGSAAERRLHNLMKEIGDTIHIVSRSDEGEEYLGIFTATGRYRYAVLNRRTAQRLKEGGYPELNAATPVAFTQFQVWVLRPNDTALLSSLNAALDSIM